MKTSASKRILLLALFIIGVSLLHYLTPLHLHYLHDIFQRFYYLPVILAALWFGFRGGLACALVVSIAYAPHILFQWGGGFALEMEKYLEIVMYNVVGSVTGLLAQRERERSVELEKTAAGLEQSYKKLQEQSEQIIAIEKNLRSAERLSALGEMAAVLAHEIRNPLGSIRGTAEILRDDYRPGDPKHEFIEIQIRETERLNRVVEEFLRMSRPLAIEKVPCHIRAELEMVATLLSNDAQKCQSTIVIAEDSVDEVIPADGEKLRQAFLNIIINALQASPPGNSVAVAIKNVNSGVEISVRDCGPGISGDNLSRIIEPFYTTKEDGTGLGLAISRKIVEGHDGTLQVESVVGQGTVVTITLPRLPMEECHEV
ncbi:MAG: ATP-binding protein [Desulfuromonadaceae bacterium]|nr:ATP-binding protein [Desulfuromonadaceae bacterium]MDD5107494.1 ATP-binding protein [Desulfuromonadaceae bacterium]